MYLETILSKTVILISYINLQTCSLPYGKHL